MEAFVPRLKRRICLGWKERIVRLKGHGRFKTLSWEQGVNPGDAVDNEIDFINEEREALGILQGKEITSMA
jgi:hypothetical protein